MLNWSLIILEDLTVSDCFSSISLLAQWSLLKCACICSRTRCTSWHCTVHQHV